MSRDPHAIEEGSTIEAVGAAPRVPSDQRPAGRGRRPQACRHHHVRRLPARYPPADQLTDRRTPGTARGRRARRLRPWWLGLSPSSAGGADREIVVLHNSRGLARNWRLVAAQRPDGVIQPAANPAYSRARLVRTGTIGNGSPVRWRGRQLGTRRLAGTPKLGGLDTAPPSTVSAAVWTPALSRAQRALVVQPRRVSRSPTDQGLPQQKKSHKLGIVVGLRGRYTCWTIRN